MHLIFVAQTQQCFLPLGYKYFVHDKTEKEGSGSLQAYAYVCHKYICHDQVHEGQCITNSQFVQGK